MLSTLNCLQIISLCTFSRKCQKVYSCFKICFSIHVFFSFDRWPLFRVNGLSRSPPVLFIVWPAPIRYYNLIRLGQVEWGWTARNAIARQSFARHFWQQINCLTQILSTARIQLILAKPDSSKWQKNDNCSTVSSSWHSFFLRQ